MSSLTNYHYLLPDQKADEEILLEFPQGKLESLRNQSLQGHLMEKQQEPHSLQK